MTPPDLPLDDDAPLDDATLTVHAVVDDEATAEQRRRVARDPELVARVTALRAVAAAVAEPVEPPPADVLAALRRRALDSLDTRDEHEHEPEVGPSDAADDLAEDDEPAPLPNRDLDTARARRRTRTLPPLPAVAAVVVLMVVVGVGLLLAGTSDKGSADRSSADAGGEAASSGAGDDAGDGEGDAAPEATTTDDDQNLSEEAGERPADATRDALLAQTTVRYPTQAALERDLRLVDVESYALARTAPDAPEDQTGGESASTTAPATGSTSGQADAFAFAADPVATRCDDVLRAAEPDLEPAVAALLVSVQGEPVLVLSNPTEVTERSPEGLRLTILNAVDCSPRAAIIR